MGTFTPDLGYYLVKFHGLAGESVTSSGSALSEVKDLATLTNQASEGWTHGTDKYGDVTYVKIEAGFSKNISVK
ncbi:hypothetical protein D3C76_1796410 [compost metagenome]